MNKLSQHCVNALWDTQSKIKATSLLHSILDFEFYQFLIRQEWSGMTIKLSSTIDIIEAYDQVNEIQ